MKLFAPLLTTNRPSPDELDEDRVQLQLRRTGDKKEK